MINLDQKEFTYLEYQDFIEKHNLESFSKSQVDAFSKDVLEKSKKQEVDEYEISCAAADYASLHPVTVVREDLTKCIMYWREAQTEGINIPNGIFKSIDDNVDKVVKKLESLGFDNVEVNEYSQYITARMEDKYDEIFEQK